MAVNCKLLNNFLSLFLLPCCVAIEISQELNQEPNPGLDSENTKS